VQRLEEKVAFLERHVAEQDKAMLELGDELRRLRKQLDIFRQRLAGGGVEQGDEMPPDERPPHY
jgi:SlyX protein